MQTGRDLVEGTSGGKLGGKQWREAVERMETEATEYDGDELIPSKLLPKRYEDNGIYIEI